MRAETIIVQYFSLWSVRGFLGTFPDFLLVRLHWMRRDDLINELLAVGDVSGGLKNPSPVNSFVISIRFHQCCHLFPLQISLDWPKAFVQDYAVVGPNRKEMEIVIKMKKTQS